MERIFNNVKITSSFDMPETGGNLISGETIGKHFGKIAKHMEDGSIHHTVDNVLSDTSENPVQNKVIKIELDNKADKTVATTETDGLMSAADKAKLDETRLWRRCVVGQSSDTTTNQYYKFASISLSDVNYDAAITFKVSLNFGDKSTYLGILTAHVRTSATACWERSELVWEYALSGIDTSKFILCHNISDSPTIAELWVKVDIAWSHYHFDVLTEGTRKTSNNSLWMLYNKSSAGSEAALPSGYVQQESTLGTIKNSISGNAATATNASKVNNHSVESDVPSDAVFTDTVEYKDAFGSPISLDDACDAPLINLKLYGKSTQDGTPTPDTPVDIVSVGDDGSINVKSCGKNLLNYDAWKTINAMMNGTAIFENNGVTITATKNDAYTYYSYDSFSELARVFVIEGETITLSWEESTNTSGRVFIFPNGKEYGLVSCNNKVQKKLTYTVPSGVSFITFRFGVDLAGDTISYKNIMIERGSEATEYEPYHGATANITSALPLCGIPVDSGGNYTDSNGHQWICDELVYNADGTGKIVKRTNKKVLSTNDTFYFYNDKSPRIGFRVSDILKISNSNLKANMLCNNHKIVTANAQYSNANIVGISQQGVGVNSTMVYISNANTNSVDAFKTWLADNPTYIIYQLATPQEIELTTEEVKSLKQLQTYNGVTNISNDGIADMYVKYWRDETIPKLLLLNSSGNSSSNDYLIQYINGGI